jgi:hypothetical protein
METLGLLLLAYLGIGAACCAHPTGATAGGDFTWRGQWTIFRTTWRAVLTWPHALWWLLRDWDASL